LPFLEHFQISIDRAFVSAEVFLSLSLSLWHAFLVGVLGGCREALLFG
jgi:hypothetical protein